MRQHQGLVAIHVGYEYSELARAEHGPAVVGHDSRPGSGMDVEPCLRYPTCSARAKKMRPWVAACFLKTNALVRATVPASRSRLIRAFETADAD